MIKCQFGCVKECQWRLKKHGAFRDGSPESKTWIRLYVIWRTEVEISLAAVREKAVTPSNAIRFTTASTNPA